jgi:hypothetical protein
MLTGKMYVWTNTPSGSLSTISHTVETHQHGPLRTDSAEVCHGSTQPFQENALLVFQITSQPLPSARFSIHFSLINPPFATFAVLTVVFIQLFSGVWHAADLKVLIPISISLHSLVSWKAWIVASNWQLMLTRCYVVFRKVTNRSATEQLM